MASFFRRLFGPPLKEIWSQFAHEIEGDLVDRGRWKQPMVVGYHRHWKIALGIFVVSTGKSSTTYTMMYAPYVKRDDFVFRISRKNIFSGIGKFFGTKDIEVGFEFFDEDFIIEGNDERKLRHFFKAPDIRQLIEYQPNIHLELNHKNHQTPKLPEGINQVYFQVIGTIKDLERLHDLYHLFCLTLDHLYDIGTAEDEDPKVL